MNLSSLNKYVNSEKVLMLLFHKPCQQFQNDNLRVKKNVIKQQVWIQEKKCKKFLVLVKLIRQSTFSAYVFNLKMYLMHIFRVSSINVPLKNCQRACILHGTSASTKIENCNMSPLLYT